MQDTISKTKKREIKMPKINYEEYDLPNGLHVILHENNDYPIAATYLYYHVGSKNEKKERTGFAHFFEHLMFEGTENIPRGQIDKLISGAGGVLNAATSFDFTNYYFLVPSNQLNLALWIESERMRSNKIDNDGVETQRSVVKEERRKSYDNRPYGNLFEVLASSVFKNTPYEWLPIGSFQYIDKATINEFKEFYKKFYIPNNAVLVVAGNFEKKLLKEQIQKYFGNIPRGSTVVQPSYDFLLDEQGKKKIIKDPRTPLPLSLNAWRIPSQNHEDSYALEILTNILSSGQSSRLHKKLVAKDALATKIGSGAVQTEGTGFFYISIVGNIDSNVETLDSAISRELSKLLNEGISQNEFDKAIQQKTTELVNSFKSLASRASALGYNYIFYKDPNRINSELENYKKITIEDVNRVTRKYISLDKKFIVQYPLTEQN